MAAERPPPSDVRSERAALRSSDPDLPASNHKYRYSVALESEM